MEKSRASRDWINNEPLTTVDVGDIHFCLEYRLVEVCGHEIELTTKEFDIFALLIMNPKRVFTYEMIFDIIWHEPYDICCRKTITNHVSSLRKKIQAVSNMPSYIKSVHNIGYKFNWSG